MFLLHVNTKSATFRARSKSIWACLELLNSKVNQILLQTETQLTLFQVSSGKVSYKSTQNKPAKFASKALSPIQTQLTLYTRHILFLEWLFPQVNTKLASVRARLKSTWVCSWIMDFQIHKMFAVQAQLIQFWSSSGTFFSRVNT